MIEFVDNEDCVDGIDRELLPTIELTATEVGTSYTLVVEVADEPRERQQGLMCREVVPHGTGMLFVFEQARSLNFWMFNTYAPLDIVYLNEDRNAVKALRMAPCPRPDGYEQDQWQNHCVSASNGYGSGSNALYALEFPAGWLESIGVELMGIEGVDFSW